MGDFTNTPDGRYAVAVIVNDYPARGLGKSIGTWLGKAWWLDDGDLYAPDALEEEYGPCQYLTSEELLSLVELGLEALRRLPTIEELRTTSVPVVDIEDAVK